MLAKSEICYFYLELDQEKEEPKDSWVELDDQGNILSYDIEEQCHSVFNNVRPLWKNQGHLGIRWLM